MTGKPTGKIKTEPTVTENGALYVAQHRLAKHRAGFFRRWRTPDANQVADIRRRREFIDAFIQEGNESESYPDQNQLKTSRLFSASVRKSSRMRAHSEAKTCKLAEGPL